MAVLPRPVMMMIWSQPAASASSTPYWMIGLSTRGSISLGCALVAGRKRVPNPAAGNTALQTFIRNSLSTMLSPEIPNRPGGGKIEPLGCSYTGCTLPKQAITEDVGAVRLASVHYSICTNSAAWLPAGVGAGRCGARHASKIETWCTQETVQCGAQDFSVRYSRWISSIVYFSKGMAG